MEKLLIEISTNLQKIVMEQGDDRFVIFTIDQPKNYYIQCMHVPDSNFINAEAVSNEYLADADKLNQEKLSKLQSIGWNTLIGNDENFQLDFKICSIEDYDHLARTIVETLIEVYDYNPKNEIDIDLNL